MEERKQDVWFVETGVNNGAGTQILWRRGILDLPIPMGAFEAADYAVRYEVRETLRGANSVITDGTEVVCAIYGRTEAKPGRRGVICTAVGRYDEGMDVFQRLMPWVQEGHREEVKVQEGARIEAFEWS